MERQKYRLYESGKVHGEYTAGQIHEMLGIPKKNVCKYAKQGAVYHKVYQISRCEDLISLGGQFKELPNEFEKRWNEAVISVKIAASKHHINLSNIGITFMN